MNESVITMAILFVAMLSLSAGYYVGNDVVRQEALRQQCAEYNSTTGDFQWKKKLD